MADKATISENKTRTLSIDDLEPYFRNPRRIGEDAISAVKSSLEKYGYQQPIVVDNQNVIIVGHTRYYAMQEMGVETVEVYVADLPDDKAREYRIVDNKTGEAGQWDQAALVIELREFNEELHAEFFPDVSLEVEQMQKEAVTQADVDAATQKTNTIKEPDHSSMTKVECPACSRQFQVKTATLPGLTADELEGLNKDGAPVE